MPVEFQVVTEALTIYSSDNVSSYKDYILPIVSALVSSCFGAGVAYFTIQAQIRKEVEKEKIKAVNYWMVKVEEAFSRLNYIKSMYKTKLTPEPTDRIGKVRVSGFNPTLITETVADLAFLSSGKSGRNWGDISRIRNLVSRYNFLILEWEKQIKQSQIVWDKVMSSSKYGEVNLRLEPKQVLEILGPREFWEHFNLTEGCIAQTDDLIIDMLEFLNEFPTYVETQLDKSFLNKWGGIVSFSIDDELKVRCSTASRERIEFLKSLSKK